MTTSKERIKQLLKERFYDKPEALLRFADIPYEDLRDFMNGKRDFTAEQYGRIADQAGVSVRWLMTGEDEADAAPTASGSLGSQADVPKSGRERKTDDPPAVAEGKEKEPSADVSKPRRGFRLKDYGCKRLAKLYEVLGFTVEKRKGEKIIRMPS